jgi:hormone-sensitive lipase
LDKSFQDKRSSTPKSANLILHCHGGGFIAHSSKSHEIYLKPWCKELHIPIVSIDYSLAPESPFPKASIECFYVYIWCILNKDMLGWTGEKIVCVGDSAGGVLVTNIVQRAIMAGIRIPDALVPIYTPFLLSYSLSPSRLMSVMDPLLNLGILWRCLAAYCGIDFKSFDSADSDSLKRLLEVNKPFDSNSITTDKTETEEKEKNLKVLQNLIGNSVYLIELLRNHQLPSNPLMSPLLSDDNLLKKMPKTYLIVSFIFNKFLTV